MLPTWFTARRGGGGLSGSTADDQWRLPAMPGGSGMFGAPSGGLGLSAGFNTTGTGTQISGLLGTPSGLNSVRSGPPDLTDYWRPLAADEGTFSRPSPWLTPRPALTPGEASIPWKWRR